MKNKFTPLQLKWIKALESGEYRQGVGSLVEFGNASDKFCCLGVACDVLGLEADDGGYYHFGKSIGGGVMPGKSYEEFHLRTEDGEAKNSRRSLVDRNDGGWSFKRIAKELRTKPWEYFTNFTAPK